MIDEFLNENIVRNKFEKKLNHYALKVHRF